MLTLKTLPPDLAKSLTAVEQSRFVRLYNGAFSSCKDRGSSDDQCDKQARKFAEQALKQHAKA